MRVLVCGDRNWSDKKTIQTVLWNLMKEHGNLTIIHGACRGADRMAAEVGYEIGADVLAFPAEWDKYGKAAGPIRNQQMINEGHPEMAIAFHNDFAHSKGTKDMVTRLRNAKVKEIQICLSLESDHE